MDDNQSQRKKKMNIKDVVREIMTIEMKMAIIMMIMRIMVIMQMKQDEKPKLNTLQ